jgi:ferrous iron transport protein A
MPRGPETFRNRGEFAFIANQLQKPARSASDVGMTVETTLDMLPAGRRARIVAVDWSALVEEEAQRLRALGIDEGARIAIAHRGVLGGRDPIAVSIGRMTIALRRVHAQAMQVEAI